MAISDRAQLDAAPFLVSRQMALSVAGYCLVQDGTLCFWGADRLKGSGSGWKPYPKCVLQLIA